MPARIKARKALNINILLDRYTDSADMRHWVLGQLIGRQVLRTGQLTQAEYAAFRGMAYPNWDQVTDYRDWTVSADFIDRVVQLAADYRQRIGGGE